MPSKILLSLVVAVVLTAPALAQRTCAAHDHHLDMMQSDPAYAAARLDVEGHTAEAVSSGVTLESVITIPVVVHIVYNSASENLPDTTIQNQIQVLNEDFRRLNPDVGSTPAAFLPVAADCEIEFCLASRDPQGQPTNGIVRVPTSVTSFSTFNDAVKFSSSGGSDAWPASDYLNIWVCDISSGILGYAQFPGGPAATDGIVVDWRSFGRNTPNALAPFNLGRTATHEVGHWLNLRHIWGDGGCSASDLVADTPDSDQPNYGCSTGIVNCNSVDMVENYMDYSDDGCMNIYTQGQKARMRALFLPGGARESILSSQGCGPVTPEFQTNSPACSLVLNGVSGTAQVPASVQVAVGDTVNTLYASSLVGSPWEVVLSFAPVVGASSGGVATAGGQFINLDLGSLLFYRSDLNFTPNFAPFPGALFEPLQMPFALSVSMQQVILTPTHPDGFVLSQPVSLTAANCTLPAFPAGPSGDDVSVEVNFAAPGCSDLSFYGASYDRFYVISNGRVTFGSASTDFSPSLNQARDNQGFAGFWTDLDPSSGGSVSITNPSPEVVRVAYNNVPYYAQTATVSFAIDFDLASDAITLSGLQGISGNPSNTGAGDRQFLGISPGNGAANTSAFTMAPGASGTVGANEMAYDYVGTGAGSLVSTVTLGTQTIILTPLPGGGYTWSAF